MVGLRVEETHARALASSASSASRLPITDVMANCTANSGASVGRAILAVQGNQGVDRMHRTAVFQYVRDASVNHYPALKPVRTFQDARYERATHAIELLRGIPHNEALALEMTLCVLGRAGIMACFPHASSVVVSSIKDPSMLTLEQVIAAYTHHQHLVETVGWTGFQPPQDYLDLLEEVRLTLERIDGCARTVSKRNREAARLRVKKHLISLWTEWADMTKRFASQEAARGRPFPRLKYASLIQGTRNRPRYGSDFTGLIHWIDALDREGQDKTLAGLPPFSDDVTPTAAATAAAAAATAAALAALAVKDNSTLAQANAAANAAAAAKALAASPAKGKGKGKGKGKAREANNEGAPPLVWSDKGTPVTRNSLLAFIQFSNDEICGKCLDKRLVDKATCGWSKCKRTHSDPGEPRKAQLAQLLKATGDAMDGGWTPPAPSPSKRTAKKAKAGK
jgi:hypothetical protein